MSGDFTADSSFAGNVQNPGTSLESLLEAMEDASKADSDTKPVILDKSLVEQMLKHLQLAMAQARQRGGLENARRHGKHSLVVNDFPLDSCTGGHYDLPSIADATSGGSDADSDDFGLPSVSADNNFVDFTSGDSVGAALNVAADSDNCSNDDKGNYPNDDSDNCSNDAKDNYPNDDRDNFSKGDEAAETECSGDGGREHSRYGICSDVDDEVDSKPSECDEDFDDDDSEDVLLYPSDQLCSNADEDASTSANTLFVSLCNHDSGFGLGVSLSILTLVATVMNITLADTSGSLQWGPPMSTIITTFFVFCLYKLAEHMYNHFSNSMKEGHAATEGYMLQGFAMFCCVQFVVSMHALTTLNAAAAGVMLDSGHDHTLNFVAEIIKAFAVVNFSAWFSSVCVDLLRDSVLDFSERVEGFVTDACGAFKLISKEDNEGGQAQRVGQKREEWKPNSLQLLLIRVFIAATVCLMSYNLRASLGEKVLLSSNRDTPSPKKQNNFSFINLTMDRDEFNREQVNSQQDSEHSYLGCSLGWDNVTALDHALLAHMANFHTETHESDLGGMKRALESVFPQDQGYNVTVDEHWGKSTRKELSQPEHSFTKYYKFDFNNRKHTVIAVQGTDDLGEVLADIRLWVASGMIDLLQLYVPSLDRLLPRQRAGFQRQLDAFREYLAIEEGQLDAYKSGVGNTHNLLHGANSCEYYRGYKQHRKSLGGDRWTMSVTLGRHMSVADHSLGDMSVTLGGMSVTDHSLGGMSVADHSLGGMPVADHSLGGMSVTGHSLGGMSVTGHSLGGMPVTGHSLGGMSVTDHSLGGMPGAGHSLGGGIAAIVGDILDTDHSFGGGMSVTDHSLGGGIAAILDIVPNVDDHIDNQKGGGYIDNPNVDDHIGNKKVDDHIGNVPFTASSSKGLLPLRQNNLTGRATSPCSVVMVDNDHDQN